MHLRWTLALGLLLAACSALAAPAEHTGRTAGGAWYRIAVPEGWQPGGPLVLYQHGLDFKQPSGPPGLGPVAEVMLEQGYAIAASSFRERGWAVLSAQRDNHELLQAFGRHVGEPGSLVAVGGSMGGLIALQLGGARGLPPVEGVYALCPAAAGSRLWDQAIDLRLAYDVICEDAGEMPAGTEPLPWAFDLDRIPDDLGDLSDQTLVLRALLPLNQCTGINLPESLRNGAMKRRLARLMEFAGTEDEKAFITQFGYATFVLSDLVRAPGKLGGRNPFDNRHVDYAGFPDVEAGIPRLAPDRLAAARLHTLSDFHGVAPGVKVLSVHTSGDALVIPGNQDFVRKRIPEAQRSIAIVREDEPSHCGFSEAEGLAGWDALRDWMAGAPRPDVPALQARCETLAAEGTHAGPCRFDANAQVTPFDEVVRPRPVQAAPAPTRANRARTRPPVHGPRAGQSRAH